MLIFHENEKSENVEIENMENFIKRLQEQLDNMTEEEKDQWILTQARLLPEYKQEDFYQSICGKKMVMNMPGLDEIAAFCDRVECGEIVMQYEAHYIKFDGFGHSRNCWEHDFYDPGHAMNFVSSVLQGCHDLIILGAYETAFKLLDQMLNLCFVIVDHPDTDDCCADASMDLEKAIDERLISIDRNDLLEDYIRSCKHALKDAAQAVDHIVSTLTAPLFKDCEINDLDLFQADDPLLSGIKSKLHEERQKLLSLLARVDEEDYLAIYQYKHQLLNLSRWTSFFEEIGKEQEQSEPSLLMVAWSEIQGLIERLSYELYMDDQMEMEEIYLLIKDLIQYGGFEREPWEVKEHILSEIYQNNYYEDYCVEEPMEELAAAICSTREEQLKRADMMMQIDDDEIRKEAAQLYRQFGDLEHCAKYYEGYQGKEAEPYEILIEYYKDADREKAVHIAEFAIQQCKIDQTAFFLFLLQDAKDKGDEQRFKKLMQSARRRKAVNMEKIREKHH